MPSDRAPAGAGRRSPTDRALTGEAEAVSCAEGARGAGGTGGGGRASSSAVRKDRQAGYPGGARAAVEDSPSNSRNGVVRFGKGAYGLPRSTTFRCVDYPTRPRGAVPCANSSSMTGDVPSCPASSRASCCPWRISARPRSSPATPAALSSDHSVVTTGRPGHRRGGLFLARECARSGCISRAAFLFSPPSARFCRAPAVKALPSWSSGHDAALRKRRRGFDSLRGHLDASRPVCSTLRSTSARSSADRAPASGAGRRGFESSRAHLAAPPGRRHDRQDDPRRSAS